MKKVLFCAALSALVMLTAQNSFADTSNSATAHVYMNVVANIAVQPGTPNVDAGSVQMGDFDATFDFRIDANTEGVAMNLAASPLFKGDDPRGTAVAPIPLNLSAGVDVSCDNANPMRGIDGNASYVGDTTIGAFPARQAEDLQFESSQNGHFSQTCRTTVTWTQDDPEKPMGEYSGKVKLAAMVMP
ncbi:MAG: hypothetical protein KKD63_04800 [Proteobacteria bacterium]|nr:hypothetical protein [Desulfobulbaceae bacterium]MBU4152180.1 hypothetical protein [Pseudomonadota bacterium]MDP2104827.1 hypothetical protein [Desulfobulbaceae bacterium]